MATRARSTQEAIRQTKPFRSSRAEAVIALALANDALRRRFARLLEPSDITHQQYNVLRILRGAGPGGLPTLDVAERMVEQSPGITRLLDRLDAKGLIARDRSAGDRRQVIVRITDRGLRLLAGLDEAVDRHDEESMGALSDREVAALVDLLTRVRTSLE
jgi:DNA-binding MarR family transcriptional regulator